MAIPVISVGASGAAWGLLAAEAVLAYRPGGLLPASLIPVIKRAALINLGINVVNSLGPDVDWAAHFGGGLVGGLLVFGGLLTVGLPRLAEASSDEPPKNRRPGWPRPAAIALTGLLAVGGVLGIVMGNPRAMLGEGSFSTRTLEPTGLRVELPELLTEQRRAQEGPLLTVV